MKVASGADEILILGVVETPLVLQAVNVVTMDTTLIFTNGVDSTQLRALSSVLNSPAVEADIKQRMGDASTDSAFRANILIAGVSSVLSTLRPTLMPSRSAVESDAVTLSGGEVAGAVIGSIVGCACCVLLAMWFIGYTAFASKSNPAAERWIPSAKVLDNGYQGDEYRGV